MSNTTQASALAPIVQQLINIASTALPVAEVIYASNPAALALVKEAESLLPFFQAVEKALATTSQQSV